MAIHFISGKPGAGKSMLAVKRMLMELRSGRRNVVTNLPLNLGRLNEYLQQTYPTENLQVLQRVRILSEDESREFWKFRGPLDPYGSLGADTSANAIGGEKGVHGVLYILDELHLFFGARDWMQTGKACLHYLSQHRKMGDTVIAVTQSVPNVDKQFRSVAQDFTVVRNEYTAKFGMFRGRGRFVWKSYLSEPTGGGTQVPFDDGSFTLDAKGVASCYDTAQGVGVAGGSADKGARAKGIPIMWVIPMMIGVASLCGIVPWLLGKGTQKFLAGGASEKVAAAAAKMNSGANPAATESQALPGTNSVPVAIGHSIDREKDDTYVVSITMGNRRANVTLSDGSVHSEDGGTIKRIFRNAVLMRDGRMLYLRQPVQGSGAKGAPVRQDGAQRLGDGPPVVVSAVSEPSAARGVVSSAAAMGTPAPLLSPLVESNSGAWVIGMDGVQRLRDPETLGNAQRSSMVFSEPRGSSIPLKR